MNICENKSTKQDCGLLLAGGKLRISKVRGFHTGGRLCINLVAAGIFKSEPKWWTGWHCDPQSHTITTAKNHLQASLLNLFPVPRPFINSSTHPSLQSVIHLYPISSFHSPPFFLPPISLLLCSRLLSFIDWTCRPGGVGFHSETSRCVLCCSTGAENMQAETGAWHHPPRWLSKLSSPEIHCVHHKDGWQSPHHDPAADTYTCMSLNVLIITVLTYGEQLGWGGFWDKSNAYGGPKNTHTHGSKNDLPPDSTKFNMHK